MTGPLPVLFHPDQLHHRPHREWTFGAQIDHPETTLRAERILAALGNDPSFALQAPTAFPEAAILRVHDARLVALYRAAESLAPGESFSPSVFPKRHQTRPDPGDLHQAGYFCYDSGTPLTSATYAAAAWSAACAADAARLVASGRARAAYGLCRPPGHHAQRDLFGGYCYFNNAAVALSALRAAGRAAIVDIDFHHGNGTQTIYYRDPDVLFVSLHGDPREFYPYFSGYAEETGTGPGVGTTINLPLPRGCDAAEYFRVLEARALSAVRAFGPEILVVSAGFDTFRDDPIGAFTLDTPDFHRLGEQLAKLGVPTLILQEGGYATEALGENVATFLRGVRDGLG